MRIHGKVLYTANSVRKGLRSTDAEGSEMCHFTHIQQSNYRQDQYLKLIQSILDVVLF